MTKTEIITRLTAITDYANSHDNGYHYELRINEWVKYGKDRTYFSIVETRDNSKHYVKKDYGFFDNNADEYVAGKGNINYDFGGNEKMEDILAAAAEEEEATDADEAETAEYTVKMYAVETAIIENDTITGWDADAIQENIEAATAQEAMELAKDYITECIINNGNDPEEAEIILRAREITGNDYGEWEYDEN